MNLLEKIEELKNTHNPADLSSKEDLAIAVMNLISIEEHLFYTYEKTEKEQYLDLLNETREIRKTYLAKIVKNPEGEVWCISKHLLASSMRLMEVGTKMLKDDRRAEAKELFDHANSLWNIFWGLNLNLLNIKDIPRETESETEIKLVSEKPGNDIKKASVFDSLNKTVKKILDCCRE